ncbi:MAG: polysaccharide deacetylase family protein [Chitinophagales bacterium]
MGNINEGQTKLTLFITIDTEDGYFDKPYLITGEGIEQEPGIAKIMTILEKYRVKGNFFVNVYEHIHYRPHVLADIVQSIFQRGHAVELHSHADPALDFYQHAIYNYSLKDQMKILGYGVDLLQQWIGVKPVAYRGGSYEFNEDTLYALYKLGIPVDSSRWYKNENNKLQMDFTINRVTPYMNTLEVPVTYVQCLDRKGHYTPSKFDLDWLSYDELTHVIELAKTFHLKTLTLFMHSFSLIRKKRKSAADQPNHAALYRSHLVANRYTEIYGLHVENIKKLERLLQYISKDPMIEVPTFKEWYKKKEESPKDIGADFIPVIDRLF